MKTVCKKLLSLMLVAVLLVSAVPMMASAAGTSIPVAITVTRSNDGKSVTNTIGHNDASSITLSEAWVQQCFSDYVASDYSTSSWTLSAWDASNTVLASGVTVNDMQAYSIPSGTARMAVSVTITHTNHTYQTVSTVAATCGQAGYTMERCSVCGDERKTNEVPATGNHTVDTWTVTKQPTVSESGTKEGKCVVCGTTVQDTVSPLASATITFKSGVDYSVSASQTYAVGSVITPPSYASVNGWVFKGWYTGTNGTGDKLDDKAVCQASDDGKTYYAWYYDNNKLSNDSYSVILRVYLKSNLQSYDSTYNITKDLAIDGRVSMSEVKNYLMERYTAKTSAGIVFDGLYQGTGDWVTAYLNDDKSAEAENVDVAVNNGTIYMNVVLDNATRKSSSSSSSNADRSNPKTGDSIYTAVAVMGLSVTALAAVYYINKKRIAY